MKQFKHQSLAGTFMVTPWISEDEFRLVASHISSDNLEDLKLAQERLFVWKVRQGRRLQDIFDITLCILSDILAINSAKGDTSQQVMLNSASLTIVRFVSLMTEGTLKDKVERSSVLELSAQIGIPEWIVDMRHQVVHSCLPSGSFVMKALMFAKDYVYEKFWSLEVNDVSLEKSEEIKDRLRALLHNQSLHVDEMKDALLRFFSPQPYPAYSIVLQEIVGYLIDLCSSHSFSDKGKLKLPAALKLSAKPVIETVRKAGFLDQLVEDLLVDLKSPAATVSWLLHIIASFYNSEEERANIQAQVVDKCLQDSSLSSVFQRIYPLFGADRELKELLQIYKRDSRVDGEINWTPRGVSDLPGQVEVESSHSDDPVDVTLSPWSLSSTTNWADTPLGMLPCSAGCSPGIADEELSPLVLEQEMGEDNSVFVPERSLPVSDWSEDELEKMKTSIVVF